MTLIGTLRSRHYAPQISRRAELHARPDTDEEAERIQLSLLNAEWARAADDVPLYGRLRLERDLPTKFDSLGEFAERVPVLTRSFIRSHRDDMTSRGRKPDVVRMTGGSTAQPIQVPAWDSELDFTRPDVWLGRSWYGIDPASRLFLIWGHSHLLGEGFRRRARAIRVRWSDRLLGYRRFSAYDIRPEMLRKAGRDMLDFRPDYVLGYSVALDLFARANAPLAASLRSLGLKAVISTAESFPSHDSVALLEDLFSCPVAMEYGAVETGLLAHTRPGGGFDVFWRTYLVETVRESLGARVLVTSLYPRCFPLVRYDLGDEVEVDEGSGGGRIAVSRFRRVIGRCNDYVRLADGTLIHSEAFSHAVRECEEINAYQVVKAGGNVRLDYLAEKTLPEKRVSEIRSRLAKVHPELAPIGIERVESLQRTIAGKTPMVITSR